jgi:hypothetical protein
MIWEHVLKKLQGKWGANIKKDHAKMFWQKLDQIVLVSKICVRSNDFYKSSEFLIKCNPLLVRSCTIQLVDDSLGSSLHLLANAFSSGIYFVSLQ